MKKQPFLNTMIIVILSLSYPSKLVAQVPVWKPGQTSFEGVVKQEIPNRDDWQKPKEILLHASSEPIPALKYRFWVSPVERKPGNVNANLVRAVLLDLERSDRIELAKQEASSSSKWGEGPLSDLPTSDLPVFLVKHAKVLKQIHYATELDTLTSSMSIRDLYGSDVVQLPLSELQNLRNLARLLQYEALLAISERRYDDAIHSIRSGFRIAEAAMTSGENTIIAKLVGIAVIGIMQSVVEVLEQQPNAPNVYWALASLPSDFWQLRTAMDSEFVSIDHLFFQSSEELGAPTSELEWERKLTKSIQMAFEVDPSFNKDLTDVKSIEAPLIAGLVLAIYNADSRQQLVLLGLDREVVQNMGNAESVMRATQMEFDKIQHDSFKWILLPTQKRQERASLATNAFMDRLSNRFVPATMLLGLGMSALEATNTAVLRSESEHARLATLEALRAYAAAHNGVLPESLDSLSPLPAWPNPDTGQPFNYHRDSDRRATLHRTPEFPGIPSTFHITIQ